MNVSSSRSSTYKDDTTSEPKRRRRRVALSCMQCKQRKIKCDRSEPCQSCIIRGIGDECRWRDEDVRGGLVTNSEARHVDGRNGERRRRQKHDELDGDDDIDLLVDAVMRKIRSRKRRNASSTERSDDQYDDISDVEDRRESLHDRDATSADPLGRSPMWPTRKSSSSLMKMPVTLEERLRYDVKPAVNTVAKRIPMSAFEGTKKAHPFFHKNEHPDDGAYVPPTTAFPSLQQLPNRRIVQQLVKVYMDQLEPVKNLFNRHILEEQLQELWDDMTECNIATDQPISTPIFYENGERAGVLDVHFDDSGKIDKQEYSTKMRHRLLSTARQGLIALVFTLCDIGARLSDMSSLIELGLAPERDTEVQMLRWCETMGSRASYHLKLSEYAARPTLWALQVMLLNDLSISAMVKWRQGIGKAYDNHFGTSGLMLSIAVSLGLNNLGSAYEDVRSATGKARGTWSDDRKLNGGGTDALKAESTSSREQKTVLATMQNGTWLAEFAQDNLAHRELGRKLWAMISTMDALMSSHFNQHFNVHDNIDHTAPPAPVDDADLLSPHAALIIAQSRPDAIVARDNTFVAYYVAIARASRLQVELENVKGAPLPYRDLLHIDQRFRNIIDILPPYLSLSLVDDNHVPVTIGKQDPQTAAFIMQRSLINDQAYFRMLRMHRMHLGKGFKDQRYRQSTLSCFEAARGILEARTAMDAVDRTVRHALFLLNHLLQAAFVFQLYLLHDLDQRRHSKTKAGSGIDDQGVYRLDDFDATVVFLQRCLHYLGPDSTVNRGFAQEQIQAVEQFLANLLRSGSKKVALKPARKQRKTSEQALANGSHSMPSSSASLTPIYHNDESLVRSSYLPSSNGTNVMIDMGSVASDHSTAQDWSATTTTSFDSNAAALNVYDPSIWSLDALFPGYEEGLDLISALENEVLTHNSNLWSGFGSTG